MQGRKLTILNFGERFRDLVSNSGMTQKELSESLGLSEGALVNYKRGRIPKAEELLSISAFFGVSLKWLLTGQERKDFLAARIVMCGNFSALAQQAYPGSPKADLLANQMVQAVEPLIDLLEEDLSLLAQGSTEWQTALNDANARLAAVKKGLTKILSALEAP